MAPAEHGPSMRMTLGSIPSTTEKGKKYMVKSVISQRDSGQTEISHTAHTCLLNASTIPESYELITHPNVKHLRHPWHFNALIITEGMNT